MARRQPPLHPLAHRHASTAGTDGADCTDTAASAADLEEVAKVANPHTTALSPTPADRDAEGQSCSTTQATRAPQHKRMASSLALNPNHAHPPHVPPQRTGSGDSHTKMLAQAKSLLDDIEEVSLLLSFCPCLLSSCPSRLLSFCPCLSIGLIGLSP